MSGNLKGFKPDGVRWPVLRHGLIFYNGGSVACFVLNRSRGGSGLVLQSNVPLPVVFDLEIDGENVRRRCVAVWRNQCRIGVSFDVEGVTEIAQDNERAVALAVRRRALLGKEESLAHLRSVRRFLMLSNIYRVAVMAKTNWSAEASANSEFAAKSRSSAR